MDDVRSRIISSNEGRCDLAYKWVPSPGFNLNKYVSLWEELSIKFILIC